MTYIRFAEKTNPNTLSLYGRQRVAAVNFSGNDYVTLSGLSVKGATTGIDLGNGSDYNTVENCTIIGCNDGILVYYNSRHNTIRRNTLHSAFYGADQAEDWGAWIGGTTYQDGIREQIREWLRHRFMNEFQEVGIRVAAAGDGNVIEENTISEKYMGIVLSENTGNKKTINIRNNNVSNIGYLGLHNERGWIATIQNNDFRNCNITYRFQQLMDFADNDRELTFKSNYSYLPKSTGLHIFWHTYNLNTYTVPPTMLFDQNVFVGGKHLMKFGWPAISTRGMLSDTTLTINELNCPTYNSYFDDTSWKLVEDNSFYQHDSDHLVERIWMGVNHLKPYFISQPSNLRIEMIQ
jgi:parallel beta-helix repeat protein